MKTLRLLLHITNQNNQIFMKKLLPYFLFTLCIVLMSNKSHAQDGMIGEVKLFAGNFAPRNWALCQGQLLSIAQYNALFAILGTTYGGDGRTTFALPDLRGRSPIGPGNGPGLSSYREGQRGGSEYVYLNTTHLPTHSHNATFTQTSGIATIPAVAEEANSDDPTNNNLAVPNIGGSNKLYSNTTPDVNLSNGTANIQGNINVLPAGNSQPFNNRNPYLSINYIICLNGIFPSRN